MKVNHKIKIRITKASKLSIIQFVREIVGLVDVIEYKNDEELIISHFSNRETFFTALRTTNYGMIWNSKNGLSKQVCFTHYEDGDHVTDITFEKGMLPVFQYIIKFNF